MRATVLVFAVMFMVSPWAGAQSLPGRFNAERLPPDSPIHLHKGMLDRRPELVPASKNEQLLMRGNLTEDKAAQCRVEGGILQKQYESLQELTALLERKLELLEDGSKTAKKPSKKKAAAPSAKSSDAAEDEPAVPASGPLGGIGLSDCNKVDDLKLKIKNQTALNNLLEEKAQVLQLSSSSGSK
ncbi:hypothetical protein [Leptothrix discophora]|uniref:Uncharacterized protein n=1 Tax=Leptothrix discophora TaxID=89 RepID=A0ABT9G222_LEPDI|nr:hypothetical protein [Leptothrix discophora]MDP4300332.1 hypothetical protein [Leptothrix discophora]